MGEFLQRKGELVMKDGFFAVILGLLAAIVLCFFRVLFLSGVSSLAIYLVMWIFKRPISWLEVFYSCTLVSSLFLVFSGDLLRSLKK